MTNTSYQLQRYPATAFALVLHLLELGKCLKQLENNNSRRLLNSFEINALFFQ